MAKRFRVVYRKENDPHSGLGVLDTELDGRYFIAYHENPSEQERKSLIEMTRLANAAPQAVDVEKVWLVRLQQEILWLIEEPSGDCTHGCNNCVECGAEPGQTHGQMCRLGLAVSKLRAAIEQAKRRGKVKP